MELSKVEKVDLREVWKHEATDFTNWLAKSENLELLSDEIGIDISLIQTEASVGDFNVDILAEEKNAGSTSRKIVIENQLQPTDHDHLGKIITYASGYNAEIIIWIVKKVRDEHKQAVDWLNDHTDSNINIFAIQMEVWKISNSPYAPKFEIIAKPNDWTKAVRKPIRYGGINHYNGKRIYKLVQDNPRRPNAKGWYSFNLITDGMTYEEYLNKGGRQKDLKWDIDRGRVKVE